MLLPPRAFAPALVLAGLGCSRETVRATPDDARQAPRPVQPAPSAHPKRDALVGRFRAVGSHRLLDSVATSGADYEFRVVDPAQWHHAYDKDEVRFRLTRASDDSLRVSDHYRPLLEGHLAAARYTPAGRVACLRTETYVLGTPLRAELKSDGTLHVEFAEVGMNLMTDPSDPLSITGCREETVRSRITVTLEPVP